MSEKYHITYVFKIFIAQFILSFIGLIIGCTWGLNIENKTWSQLINNEIKIVDSGVKSNTNSKATPKQVNENSLDAAVQPKKDEGTKALSLINTCISSFSTSFDSSSPSRVNNIEVCVKAINGKVLMPGEIFSFNEVVGERTKQRGYLEAPVIVESKVESGLGGGICQVSSTLYNAILRSGIQNIDRTHHSLPTTYLGLGLDATVDWENIDLKFTNTLEYPIYIEGQIKNKNLYINILSNSNLSNKKYIIENNITKEGNAYKVEVTRKTYESGMLINSESISKDVYKPVATALKKSTKY